MLRNFIENLRTEKRSEICSETADCSWVENEENEKGEKFSLKW